MENFHAEIKEINGKKVLMFKPRVEEVIREDGTKDIIVHAPSLDLINKTLEKNNKGD